MDKEVIKKAKTYRKLFKEQAERHESTARDNRDMERICDELIKKEQSKDIKWSQK